ncbi:MAG: DNA primase small subunit domain-containing protein [Candidatus Thorarchaeota archaeon]
MAQSKNKLTRKFLQLTFQDYYRTNHYKVDIPQNIHQREFAMQSWDYRWICNKRIKKREDGSEFQTGCGQSGSVFYRMTECPFCGNPDLDFPDWSRHIGFRSKDNLLNSLVTSVPHSIYHSSAFYRIPVARNMSEKDWQGAELIFDIDADHLDSSCAKKHDSWKCKNPECNNVGMGAHPDKCPKCDSTDSNSGNTKNYGFMQIKWICDNCLEDAKKNTLKLYDKFLVSHFGIDPEMMQLNYSGHRGYHVRVRAPHLFNLDTRARLAIAQYVTGMGLSSSITTDGRLSIVPTGDLTNWQLPSVARKVADAMIEFIENIDAYQGGERWVNPLKTNRESALDGLSRNPPLLSGKVKKVGSKSWQDIATKATLLYSSDIDMPVTHDIHRVIRLIGSLNGKTGFTVNHITRDELDDFDPFDDALVFTGGTLKVFIHGRSMKVPEFRIGEETFGPYMQEMAELPKSAAIFLMCKGMATLER